MRVLLLHNRYKIQGGEDVVVAQEAALLRQAGVPVEVFEVTNDEISGWQEKVKTAALVAYSPAMREQVRKNIRDFGANVVHVHNFFPRLTPSAYDAALEEGCAVVQTLHNYRLVCAAGLLFRDGGVCTDCLRHTSRWPALVHRCYRGSLAGSATLTAMVKFHQGRGTWQTRVDRFITLTEFARTLLVEHADLPPDRVVVKPNAVFDLRRKEEVAGGDMTSAPYALFVGRLSAEKGLDAILAAVASGRFPLPLKIAGRGPMEHAVRAACRPGVIEFLGGQSREAVGGLMRGASLLLAPSIWHEAGVPLVIGEAFSAGVPVITTRLKPMEDMVRDGESGLLVAPGDAGAICDAAIRLAGDRELAARIRRNGRAIYEENYLPEKNAALLQQVYRSALAVAELRERAR